MKMRPKYLLYCTQYGTRTVLGGTNFFIVTVLYTTFHLQVHIPTTSTLRLPFLQVAASTTGRGRRSRAERRRHHPSRPLPARARLALALGLWPTPS